MKHEESWLALIMSLPANNPAARMRIWRGLKSIGSAVLRDGVYLMPDRPGVERELMALHEDVAKSGGSAHLLRIVSLDERQMAFFQQLFDRADNYGALLSDIDDFMKEVDTADGGSARKSFRRLQRELDGIVHIDFYPGFARQQAEAALDKAKAKLEATMGIVTAATSTLEVKRLNLKEYNNRQWATYEPLEADRLASTWLIQRFIDPQATFIWLRQSDTSPQNTVGFDFDGATFARTGNKVTFEVLLASFGLDKDTPLERIGALVHYLDVGGMPTPEAAGLSAILRGAQRQSLNNDELMNATSRALDLLYAAFVEEGAAHP